MADDYKKQRESSDRRSEPTRKPERPERVEPAPAPVAPPGPSADLQAFLTKIRPLMSTVMAAHRDGHPHLPKHLQALSDAIQS